MNSSPNSTPNLTYIELLLCVPICNDITIDVWLEFIRFCMKDIVRKGINANSACKPAPNPTFHVNWIMQIVAHLQLWYHVGENKTPKWKPSANLKTSFLPLFFTCILLWLVFINYLLFNCIKPRSKLKAFSANCY